MKLNYQGPWRILHQIKPLNQGVFLMDAVDQLHFPGLDMRLIWYGWLHVLWRSSGKDAQCHATVTASGFAD